MNYDDLMKIKSKSELDDKEDIAEKDKVINLFREQNIMQISYILKQGRRNNELLDSDINHLISVITAVLIATAYENIDECLINYKKIHQETITNFEKLDEAINK